MQGNIDPALLQETREHIGALLRNRRKKLGLSQNDLSKKMGIRRPTISNVEAGKWAITVDMLTLFCHHLDIPIKKLFK